MLYTISDFIWRELVRNFASLLRVSACAAFMRGVISPSNCGLWEIWSYQMIRATGIVPGLLKLQR